MLLALDIGNTNITLGVWNGRSWQHTWRLLTNPAQTADEYGILLKMLLHDAGLLTAVDQAIMASVVPALSHSLAALDALPNYVRWVIAENRIDALIIFWDPMEPQPHDVDVKALLRIAVVYNTPIACNRATADFILSSHLMAEKYERIVPNLTRTISVR